MEVIQLNIYDFKVILAEIDFDKVKAIADATKTKADVVMCMVLAVGMDKLMMDFVVKET